MASIISNAVYTFLRNTVLPRMNPRIQSTMKIKNSVLAIPAAPAAMPVNPNIAAIIAITRKIADHLNMIIYFIVSMVRKNACQVNFHLYILFLT